MKIKLLCLVMILALAATAQAEWETVIPSDSLTPTNFDTYWNWFYPWGDTHNGSAKMYIDQVTLDASGMATIVAETPDPESEWNYRSGTFHSKFWIVLDSHYPEWDIKGEFKAPTIKGAWPAFWITGAWNWPPEVDILEFKGDTNNWFNTYDGGWESNSFQVPDAATVWHEYRCHLTQIDDTEVKVEFYLDGSLKFTHTGSNFMEDPFDLIVNMQMEGSSGSPGPTDPTYYYARNIVITRDATPAPPGPPSAPTNLEAAFGDTEISLNWDASPEWDVDYYSVKRSTTTGGPYSLIDTTMALTYIDTGLTNGTTYYYVVTATDLDVNESGNSNEALTTPVIPNPVTVGNYSFELPGTVKQSDWENVPNWSSDSHVSDSGVESSFPTTDGIWRGFLMSTDPSVWNLTDYTISSGEQFNLAIDLLGNLDISLYYDDGGSRVEVVSKAFKTTSDDYAKYTLTFAADNVPDSVGKKIGIELDNTDAGTGWSGFDYVRLDSNIGGAPDITPPNPDPMTWSTVPYATGTTSISMTATTATDPSGVEYYFTCTAGGGNDSGWQDDTMYEDTGLTPETQYTYTVSASDKSVNQNTTAVSTAESATTDPTGTIYDFANSDIPVFGTVSGSYLDTQNSDNVYESIQEVESGGRPASRYSYLEHKWTVNVTGGTSVTFYVEAYQTSSSDDNFVFAYSTNDSSYTNMVTVTKTGDDNVAQSYTLPASTSGTIYIRVKDTDQTAGNRDKDTIYIDEMYVKSADSGSYCGDETCDPGEDQCNCPDDCGTPPSTETSCTDGVDNDCDTYTDCDDSDCDTDPACVEPFCGDETCDPGEDQCNCPEDCGTPPSTETSCTDEVDNDCDTYVDCDDSDCDGDPACPSTECGNDICEEGEDCNSCSADCDGRSSGQPSGRFCCGNGIAEDAEGDGSICDGNY